MTTDNKPELMPDKIWIWKPEILLGEFTGSSHPHKNPAVQYTRTDLYEALQSKYAALKEVADGMEAALEGAKLRLEGAGMLGGMTDPVAYQLTAYQAHKEESDGV